MADEPIPLYDGELSGSVIIPDGPSGALGTPTVRSRRVHKRRPGDGVCVCFSPTLFSGRVEHVECPVFNISAKGFAIEYDRKLEVGVTGYITYRTVSHQPVHVSCRVQRCSPLENGHFLVGLKLNRKLEIEETKPAKPRPGRDLAPGLRARKLHDPETPLPETP
jgi:hypothetical protein